MLGDEVIVLASARGFCPATGTDADNATKTTVNCRTIVRSRYPRSVFQVNSNSGGHRAKMRPEPCYKNGPAGLKTTLAKDVV